MKNPAQTLTGLVALATAIGFNAAFAALGATFEYPDILRQPANEVLAAFAAGGNSLILTWYAFALTALALIPLSMALALHRSSGGAMAISAAVLGSLAGLTQAIGLMRWIFVVPMLAREPGPQSEAIFSLMNQFGGVEIGEHLGQILTAFFLFAMAIFYRGEGARIRPAVAVLTAVAIVIGTSEGVLMALDLGPGITPLAGIVGYLGLSVWLVLSGIARIRRG